MPFLISILIHSLIGAGVFWGTAQNGKGDGSEDKIKNEANKLKGGTKSREIVPIEIKMVPELVVTKEKDPNGVKNVKVSKIECASYFGGIGINFSAGDSVILKVIKGYPAYKSGCVESGDVVFRVESNNGTIEGDIGTPVRLTLIRDGVRLTCTLIRGKICIKDI